MEKSPLQNLEDRIEHAERISHICNWESDRTFSSWTYASSNTENLLGIAADRMLGDFTIYLKNIHPDDREKVEDVYAQVSVMQQAYEVEYRFQRPDGRVITLHEYGEPIRDSGDILVGFRGTTQDITQLKCLIGKQMLPLRFKPTFRIT